MTSMPPLSIASATLKLPIETWIPPDIRFLSIWEIPQMMKCPLVGTCLSIEEHQRLLKKAGICVRRMSGPALHETVMRSIDEPSRAARRIDTFFRKHLEPQAQAWLHAPESDIRTLWEKGVLDGDIDVPLYIIACRSNISSSLQFQVFGELHMLGHTAKRDLLESRRTIARLEKILALEKDTFRRLQREYQEDITRMQGELSKIQSPLPRQDRDEHTGIREESRENMELLRERLQRMQEKNQALTERVRKLEQERETLRRCPESREQAALPTCKKEKERIPDFPCACPDPGHCHSLAQRRILVVGGRPCMQTLYRHAVESAGGCFEYHDGCIHGGKQSLEARVRRSDLVLCPVNCNSHGACGMVKDICRKHGKCLRMLDSSSRSAIAAALNTAILSSTAPPTLNTPLIAGKHLPAISGQENRQNGSRMDLN